MIYKIKNHNINRRNISKNERKNIFNLIYRLREKKERQESISDKKNKTNKNKTNKNKNKIKTNQNKKKTTNTKAIVSYSHKDSKLAYLLPRN